jgi:hypothetical protein
MSWIARIKGRAEEAEYGKINKMADDFSVSRKGNGF